MAGQSTLKKRPAASTRFSSSCKRPASSMTSTLEDLRQGVRGKEKDAKDSKKDGSSTEEEDPDDPADAEGNKRSKGKGLKFAQMRDKLPPHIIELYDKAPLRKQAPVLSGPK